MSKLDQLKALGAAKAASRSKGLRIHSRGPKVAGQVGDGVALTSMVHPAGLIEKIASAIVSGKLPGLKRGRPKITEVRPWETAGMSKRTWYRRRQKEQRK